jgi:hypothetical protein
MAAPVIIPEAQFIDADGHPYAGGSLASYIVGTSTPKATWLDPAGAALNTNPVILDAAGRCLLWGDGDYRLILRDAAGNLIWDQPATTIVSAAMGPVVSAPTIADAVGLLGISDLIAAEASARAAADSTEQTARIAADNTLTTNLAAEVTRAETEEASLQTQIDALSGGGGTVNTVQGGQGNASGGHVRITFPTPYTSVLSVVATTTGADYTPITTLLTFDNTGADIYINEVDTGPASGTVNWMAIGVI